MSGAADAPRALRSHLKPEWLAVVPILAGWINDSFIFHYLASGVQLSPAQVSYFALFDLLEKMLLSGLSGYIFLCAVNPAYQHKLPHFFRDKNASANLRKTGAGSVVFLMLFLETLVRMGAIFHWVGIEVYHLASAWNVSTTVWACWPLFFWSASIFLGQNLGEYFDKRDSKQGE